jgi:hypothetical protein
MVKNSIIVWSWDVCADISSAVAASYTMAEERQAHTSGSAAADVKA